MESNEVSLDPQNASEWRRVEHLGQAMVRDMLEHFRTLREQPAWQPMPDQVKARLAAEPLPLEGMPLDQVYADFQRDVLPYAGGNLHPRFWGWVMGNGSVGGMLAELLAAGMNSNLWGGDHAAMEVEALVLRWCKAVMGFPDEASGLLTSGCSMANLIALAAARNRLLEGRIGAEGLTALSGRPVVYASAEAHNSIVKALDLLGLGRDSLSGIAVDSEFRMDPSALRQGLDRDIAAGLLPLAVVATAGTVGTGAIDPLAAIASICREYGIWMHVDGAFGALARLDPNSAALLDGIERADSLAFDFHKWLSVPYEAGCVLIKSKKDHLRPFEHQTAYLAASSGGPGAGEHWFCDLGPELSRGFRGLKVWMTLREHGLEKFGRIIHQSTCHARYLARSLEAHDSLELLAPVSLNIVCFRYRGTATTSEAERERVTRQALEHLQSQGIAVPSHTRVRGTFAVRAAFVNHRTRKHDVDTFLAQFLEACTECADADLARSA